MSFDARRRFRRPRIAAWLGLLLAVLLLVAAGFADRQLKTSTHPGFLPEDMPLYLYTADLPMAWLRFSRTTLGVNLAEEASAALRGMELSIRQSTGIRPTPSRLRTWLGGSMVAAVDGRDWILCARPGLAARAASIFFGGKVFHNGRLHQAWRSGFLLISSNSGMIEKALAAPPVIFDIPEGISRGAVVMELRRPLRAVIAVTPSATLPVEARILPTETFSPGPSGTWAAPVLAGSPTALLSFSDAQSAAKLGTLVAAIDMPEVAGGIFPELVSRWSLGRLPSLLSRNPAPNTPISCALYDLSTAYGAPMPQLAAATSATQWLDALLPPSSPASSLLSYEWSGCSGWMFPLLGDQFSLYGFKRDDTQYLATQENLAAMLAAAPATTEPGIEDNAVITLDWQRAASIIMETAAWAAIHELLAETSATDLDATLMPVMRALAKCGIMHIGARWTSDGLSCRGVLTGVPRMAGTQ